ncbi:MAG: rhodanese-like domain-containing protein [Candidatus Aminicenantes bacterium]|jgi:rhodanese-related sulfurtransferase|nr:rhodanese-like domain-containing protein [Candidatus Aminicenantes bacterium]
MKRRQLALVELSLLLWMGTLSLFCRLPVNKVEDVAAREAYDLMQKNLDNPDFVIIDVRTPGEYNDGHLKGAVNINLNSETFQEDIAKLDRIKTYLVYCRSGRRSSGAVSIMQQLEFEHIYHLARGIIEWNAEGLPLETNDRNCFSAPGLTEMSATAVLRAGP